MTLTVDSDIVADLVNVSDLVAGNLTGTLQTAAQSNITSLGTLTSLNVDGSIVATDATLLSLTVDSDIVADLVNVSDLVAGNLTGTLQTAAQSNITSLGTLTGLEVSGTVTITGNDAIQIPVGETGDRPVTVSDGMLRYNSTSGEFEGYISGTWDSIGGGVESSLAVSDITTITLTATSDVTADILCGSDVYAGNVYATGTMEGFSNTTKSDSRLKTNVRGIQSALDIIESLEGVRYTDKMGNERVGLIAQQTERVLPEVVHLGNDGFYSISYGEIVGVLVEAVKELQKNKQDKKKKKTKISLKPRHANNE